MSTFGLIVFVLPLVLPLLVHLGRKNVSFHAVVRHGNHTEIFGYLANVSAFQALNPTIVEISRWERMNERNFYVEYSECLWQVPVVRNHARAYYRIQNGGDGSHVLASRHSTCFLLNLFCLPTDSRLNIIKLSKSEVGYREDISYFCPWALEKFCFNEVAAQRKLIVSHLKEKFSDTGNP